jgi:hypothetical protein
MEMAVFWVVAACSLLEVYRRFGDACCLHHLATTPLYVIINIGGITDYIPRYFLLLQLRTNSGSMNKLYARTVHHIASCHRRAEQKSARKYIHR